jgi:hypothetical protein
MTSAEVLELLTKGSLYELHQDYCDRLRYGLDDDRDCDCPGPDLLKEIKEALVYGK